KRRATQHSAVQCGIEAAVRSPPTWHGPPRPPSNHHAVPGPAPSPLRCVALALSRCHTCTLTSTLTNVPLVRTWYYAQQPTQPPPPGNHTVSITVQPRHPPSGPRPSTAPRPGPVALLHASPIASWWRRRPILARRNLIRQAVPKSLSRPSRSLNQTKRPLPAPPRGSALLLLFCFPPFLFFVPPAPKPDPILTTANLPFTTFDTKKSKKLPPTDFCISSTLNFFPPQS
ncbi:hypothetical protein CFAM422_011945, partial [Trichoderma lentiforme]